MARGLCGGQEWGGEAHGSQELPGGWGLGGFEAEAGSGVPKEKVVCHVFAGVGAAGG